MPAVCKICASAAVLHLTGKKKQPYHFCEECEFIFKDPVLYAEAALEKERYLAHRNSPANNGYVEFLTRFFETAVQPYTTLESTLLDFGSGPVPVFAELLAGKGLSVDLYDPYFAPSEIYRERQYDAITLVEVLEHIKAPLTVFTELLCRLKPHGIIALMTRFHPRNRNQFTNWWYREDITHVGFFSMITMQYLAHLYNLELIYTNGKDTCTFRKCE